MKERVMTLKELLKTSFLWKKLEEAFGQQNKGITDQILELYVFVIDAQAPDNLAAIKKQYFLMTEIAQRNLRDYKEVYDNVEAFLRKLWYVVNPNDASGYMGYTGVITEENGEERKGLISFCKKINLIQEDYFTHSATGEKRKLYKIIKNVAIVRNKGVHEAPGDELSKIEEIVWQSLFWELWAIKQYENELIEAKNRLAGSQYEEVVALYQKQQIQEYEKTLESGFQYIQIEYENMQDPELDLEDADFKVIKGTADTLMKSINFDETPSIKLVAEAGMGKTKMVEYINYALMKDMVEKEGKVFPLLIYCNDTQGDIKNYVFEDTVLGKLKGFLTDNNLDYIPEKGLLDYLLKNYKVMYLLDGLNEINRSNTDKSKFIKSLMEYIKKDVNKRGYYLMTERYSRGATTVKNNVVYYKLSEISDEIKMEFFKSKGAETLFKRLEIISESYDSETQRELNTLLRRPFYLTVFCELSDTLEQVDNKKLPKTKQELMDFFVRELIKRENKKGEIAANYRYVRLYLIKLAELLMSDNRIALMQVLRGFAEVTNENGLNNQEYSSDHILELFEQLGFIHCSDDKWIYVDDIYAAYMEELLMEEL